MLFLLENRQTFLAYPSKGKSVYQSFAMVELKKTGMWSQGKDGMVGLIILAHFSPFQHHSSLENLISLPSRQPNIWKVLSRKPFNMSVKVRARV